LLLGLLPLEACEPPVGDLPSDDDYVTDDDDDDDDDDATDDDDTSVPSVPLSGAIRHTANNGPVPQAPVNVGLMSLDLITLTFGAERFTTVTSESSIASGDTIYTLSIQEDPLDEDFAAMDESGTEVAFFGVFAYVDADASGQWNEAELILGSSEMLFGFARFPGEDIPDVLASVGAGAGWHLANYDSLIDEEGGVTHVPEGTNSTNGPLIEVDLLPRTGGNIPVTSGLTLPLGSQVSALHVSAEKLGVQDNLITQSQALSVAEPGLAGEWTLAGDPPTSHSMDLSALGFGAGWTTPFPSGAAYSAYAWFDGGADGNPTGDPCDSGLGFAEDRALMWLDAYSLSLTSAFSIQRTGVPLGWSLYDHSAEAFRVLSLGLTVTPADPPVSVPESCLPPTGDDDDSAGDDDDSAGG
jgi:hypothetical protein